MYILYAAPGKVTYFLLLPVLFIHGYFLKKPRVRVAIVFNGEVLLVKNWLSTQKWTLPGGGVGRTETEADALLREIKEELGIEIQANCLRHAYTGASRSKLQSFAVSVYVVELNKKPALLTDTREIVDATWVSSVELTKNSAYSEVDFYYATSDRIETTK